MVEIRGVTGLMPIQEVLTEVATPPFDMIEEDTELEYFLKARGKSLIHVTRGKQPLLKLNELIGGGIFEAINNSYIIIEESFNGASRLGFLGAPKLSIKFNADILETENTFEDRLMDRFELFKETDYVLEPLMFLTRSNVTPILEQIVETHKPIRKFKSDYGSVSNTDLHGINYRIFRTDADSQEGTLLAKTVEPKPFVILDGHHRTAAMLLYLKFLNRQQGYGLSYILEASQIMKKDQNGKNGILAYNRVFNSDANFEYIKDKLGLREVPEFETPPKHSFSLYHNGRSYQFKAKEVPRDVVEGLDCRIFERDYLPIFGITDEMKKNRDIFYYYPESRIAKLDQIKKPVDLRKYKFALAFHELSVEEVEAVGYAGRRIPEKSFCVMPKPPSGIIIQPAMY